MHLTGESTKQGVSIICKSKAHLPLHCSKTCQQLPARVTILSITSKLCLLVDMEICRYKQVPQFTIQMDTDSCVVKEVKLALIKQLLHVGVCCCMLTFQISMTGCNAMICRLKCVVYFDQRPHACACVCMVENDKKCS